MCVDVSFPFQLFSAIQPVEKATFELGNNMQPRYSMYIRLLYLTITKYGAVISSIFHSLFISSNISITIIMKMYSSWGPNPHGIPATPTSTATIIIMNMMSIVFWTVICAPFSGSGSFEASPPASPQSQLLSLHLSLLRHVQLCVDVPATLSFRSLQMRVSLIEEAQLRLVDTVSLSVGNGMESVYGGGGGQCYINQW